MKGAVCRQLWLACLAASVASAQGAPARSPAEVASPLTLERAIALAAQRNEIAGIAQARVERARGITREAWSRLLPTAALQGIYTRRPTEVTRQVGDTEVVVQSRNALRAIGTAEATLLDAPAIPLVLRARRLEDAERYGAEALLLDLSHTVAETFFGVLSAEELRDAAQRRVEVATESLEVARRRLQAGLVGRQEVTRTELELSNARLALNEAELLVETERLALGELLALEADMPLAAPPPDEVQSGIRLADRVRPDVLALQQELRAAELFALEPWLRLIPSLGVQATYSLTNEPGLSGQVSNWSLGATATWVLYDGGLRYAQAAIRRAEATELRLTLSALERSVQREKDEAAARIKSARRALEEARTGARIAQENASEVERLFEAGLATALERADAIASAYEAEAELARNLFALRVAQLQARRARGLGPLDAIEGSGEVP